MEGQNEANANQQVGVKGRGDRGLPLLAVGWWGDSSAGLVLHFYCSFVRDTKEPKNRGWRKII